jgi:hypothetical protein
LYKITKYFIALFLLLNISLNAKIITLQDIDTSKAIIQLSVSPLESDFNFLLNRLSKYDLYVEKINNYTLYLVNISDNDKENILKYIHKRYIYDAYIINNSHFVKAKKLLQKKNINKKVNEQKKINKVKIIKKQSIKKIIKNDNQQIIKVGILINKISDIDFVKQSVKLDFDIWFRSKKNIDVSKLYFTNAIDKFDFNSSSEKKYIRFNFNGKFALDYDTKRFEVTKHLIGFSLLNKMVSSRQVLFEVDNEYMEIAKTNTFENILNQSNIFIKTSLKVRKADIYQKLIKLKTLADPSLCINNNKNFNASSFNMEIIVDDKVFDVSKFLPLPYASVLA